MVFERELSDLGPRPPSAHERDGLRLGVNGRDGHGHLADGEIVPHSFAPSAFAGGRRRVLEFRRAAWRRRNSHRRQHWLSMARVSALRRDRSFCRLFAHHVVGRAHVSFPARRPDLHHAMVFARRISLVPMALRRWAVNALRRAGPGRFASGGRLVVRK